MKRLALALFLFAAALSAQEKSEATAGEVAARWVNFAILVAALGYLCAKTLPPFFKSRTAEIQEGIREAQKVKADAEQRAAEMESRMASLGADIEKFRIQANAEMEQEAARITADTKRQVARLEQQAKAEIEAAAKVARRELQAYAANLALDLAEKRVAQRLDRATDAGLIDDFVHDLAVSGSEASRN
jgi:F-type H+-transporting ATPase subunit b